MNCQLRRVFVASAFLVVMLFLGYPGAWAETYSSLNQQYPTHFDNTAFDTNHNDLMYMDAVNFAGREIVLFTLMSDDDLNYNRYLYYFAHSPEDHNKFDIGNSQDNNFRFKVVEFNNLLYLFYTSEHNANGFNTSTIYYRTATMNYESDGNGCTLEFSPLKSFSTGVSSVEIRMAHSMEGALYVIFSSGSTWYSVSSADGLFNSATPNSLVKMTLFSASDVKGAGGAIFQVPDPTEGSLDRLMIAYATGSAVKYYFFDGKVLYGNPTAGNSAYVLSSSGVWPYSVRLIAGSGSASPYTDSKYSIQVFIASPKDSGSNQTWNNIFHREYIPAGVKGNEGTWPGAWVHLAASDEDDVKSVNAFDSDPAWAVLPLYTSVSKEPAADIQSYLRIWYHRGTKYSWPTSDFVRFRCSYYKSDILVHQLPQRVGGTEIQDLSTQTVLGVIEGTPPWPVNAGGGTSDTSNTSWVEYGKTDGITVETKWSVGGSVTVSKGFTFKKRGELKTKLTAGLKYTKTTSSNSTTSKGITLKTYNDATPGRLGWLVVLIPEILNDSYVLKSYDGTALHYEGDPSTDEITVNLLTYGDNTRVDLIDYYLDNPSLAIGEDEGNSSRTLMEGMAARPLSNVIPNGIETKGWKGVTEDYSQMSVSPSCPWDVTNLMTLVDPDASNSGYKDLILHSTGGESSTYSVTYSTTEGETWSPSASFTASWEKAGFLFFSGGEFNVNWTMDISTTSTMTSKLGFQYNIPDCCSPSYVIHGGKYYFCKQSHLSSYTNEPGVGLDWMNYWQEVATRTTIEWATNRNYYNCAGLDCYSTMQVIPKLFVPKADESGYNCPWISNDIRNYGKPKPWCLTYYVYPPSTSAAPQSSRITLKQAKATLHLDRVNPDNNQVSARLSLEGIGPDFLDQIGKLVHLNLGSYVIDSGVNPVVSREIRGKSVVYQMKQAANPKSSIKVVLTYDESRSLLNIAFDADQIRMPGVAQSLVNAYTEGNAVAFPVGLFIGSRYYSQDTLDAHLTVNNQNIICELNAQR